MCDSDRTWCVEYHNEHFQRSLHGAADNVYGVLAANGWRTSSVVLMVRHSYMQYSCTTVVLARTSVIAVSQPDIYMYEPPARKHMAISVGLE